MESLFVKTNDFDASIANNNTEAVTAERVNFLLPQTMQTRHGLRLKFDLRAKSTNSMTNLVAV